MSTPPKELRAEFVPLRRASKGARVRLYIIGPITWVVAIAVVALVVHHADSVEIALLILAGAFLLSLVVLLPGRRRRVREERGQ